MLYVRPIDHKFPECVSDVVILHLILGCVVHSWDKSCANSSTKLFFGSFVACAKVYASLYIVSFIDWGLILNNRINSSFCLAIGFAPRPTAQILADQTTAWNIPFNFVPLGQLRTLFDILLSNEVFWISISDSALLDFKSMFFQQKKNSWRHFLCWFFNQLNISFVLRHFNRAETKVFLVHIFIHLLIASLTYLVLRRGVLALYLTNLVKTILAL